MNATVFTQGLHPSQQKRTDPVVVPLPCRSAACAGPRPDQLQPESLKRLYSEYSRQYIGHGGLLDDGHLRDRSAVQKLQSRPLGEGVGGAGVRCPALDCWPVPREGGIQSVPLGLLMKAETQLCREKSSRPRESFETSCFSTEAKVLPEVSPDATGLELREETSSWSDHSDPRKICHNHASKRVFVEAAAATDAAHGAPQTSVEGIQRRGTRVAGSERRRGSSITCKSSGGPMPGNAVLRNGVKFVVPPKTGRKVQYRNTKLCPWFKFGNCFMGDACNYAHGAEELRQRPDLTKTALCKSGKLCVDADCRFAHHPGELRATRAFYRTKLCKFWLRGACPAGAECRHAHDGTQLRKPCTSPPSEVRGSAATLDGTSQLQTGLSPCRALSCGQRGTLSTQEPMVPELSEDTREPERHCVRAVTPAIRKVGSPEGVKKSNSRAVNRGSLLPSLASRPSQSRESFGAFEGGASIPEYHDCRAAAASHLPAASASMVNRWISAATPTKVLNSEDTAAPSPSTKEKADCSIPCECSAATTISGVPSTNHSLDCSECSTPSSYRWATPQSKPSKTDTQSASPKLINCSEHREDEAVAAALQALLGLTMMQRSASTALVGDCRESPTEQRDGSQRLESLGRVGERPNNSSANDGLSDNSVENPPESWKLKRIQEEALRKQQIWELIGWLAGQAQGAGQEKCPDSSASITTESTDNESSHWASEYKVDSMRGWRREEIPETCLSLLSPTVDQLLLSCSAAPLF